MMKTTIYKSVLLVGMIAALPIFAVAADPAPKPDAAKTVPSVTPNPPPAKITADDQAKVDEVIKEATSPVRASDLSKPITAPKEKKSSGGEKAIVTLKGSNEPLKIPEIKKEPGKAEVKLGQQKKPAETDKAAKAVEPKLPQHAKAAPAKKTPPKNITAKGAPKPPVKASKKPLLNAAAKEKPKAVVTAKKTEPVKPKFEGATKPLSSYELGRYQYCGDDRDCMAAVNGCCDCANGGEDVSVNKERFEAFRARFSCMYVGCGEKDGQKCGTGLVSCVNHKCRYFSDRALDSKF